MLTRLFLCFKNKKTLDDVNKRYTVIVFLRSAGLEGIYVLPRLNCTPMTYSYSLSETASFVHIWKNKWIISFFLIRNIADDIL